MGNEKKEICLEVLMIFRFFLVEIMENLGRIKKLEVKKKLVFYHVCLVQG